MVGTNIGFRRFIKNSHKNLLSSILPCLSPCDCTLESATSPKKIWITFCVKNERISLPATSRTTEHVSLLRVPKQEAHNILERFAPLHGRSQADDYRRNHQCGHAGGD